MSNTIDRPLPTDLPTLRRHYLPVEPDATTVTRLRAAIARIDAVSAELRAAVQRTDELDRVLVGELVDTALADENLDEMVARLDPSERIVLGHQFEQLQNARSTAMSRLAHAERTDPSHLAWRAECTQIEDDWRSAVDSAEDSSQRFDNLVRFTESLGR